MNLYNHENRATYFNCKQMWSAHLATKLPSSSAARSLFSVTFAGISRTCLTERYCIHFEGQQDHQGGCYRYPQGASDFRPQQNGQVHALSIINVPPGFTFECNEPWRPRHMCISYYCFWSAHRSFSLWHLTFFHNNICI